MSGKSSSNGKTKIMVVDDDVAILDSLKMLLEEFGYEVETTVDGWAAYELKKALPDLILLDIWMSGVDGRDVCKYLKKQKQTKHIPIIMFSANKDTSEIAKISGADDFISKPFDMKDLLDKVAEYTS